MLSKKNSAENHLTSFFILLYQVSKPRFHEHFPTDLTQNPHKPIMAFPNIFLTLGSGFTIILITIREKKKEKSYLKYAGKETLTYN